MTVTKVYEIIQRSDIQAGVKSTGDYRNLHPFWQRDYECWNDEMKTQLIESINKIIPYNEYNRR
tara:strand:+ start:6818 stop:7009 length:192 start_codon:yes stop_codon:yes gene_type:complete